MCVCVPALSCPTLWVPMDYSLPGFSVHGIFQARNTGVRFHFLLQGILLTQGLNPHLLHLLLWQADSLPNWKSVSLGDLRTYNEQVAEQILEFCFLWCHILFSCKILYTYCLYFFNWHWYVYIPKYLEQERHLVLWSLLNASVLKTTYLSIYLLNWCFWTVVLEKTLESSLDCKEIQPVYHFL